MIFFFWLSFLFAPKCCSALKCFCKGGTSKGCYSSPFVEEFGSSRCEPFGCCATSSTCGTVVAGIATEIGCLNIGGTECCTAGMVETDL